MSRDEAAAICCLAGFATILLILCIIIIALIKTPGVKIGSVTVQNLVHGNSSSSPFFNITLGAKIIVKNPNILFNFDFGNTMVSFYYGSEVVGNVEVEGGTAGLRRKTRNVMVNVKYYGGSESGMLNLRRDIESGSLELSCGGNFKGSFTVFTGDNDSHIRRWKTAVMNCIVNLI